MHATRAPLLLAAFALTAALPVAVLIDGDAGPAPPVLAEPSCAPPSGERPAFAGASSLDGSRDSAPVAVLAEAAVVDERDAEIERLCVALVASAEENERLRAELRESDKLWAARLARSRLEDDLHAMLQSDFPDLLTPQDPNADESAEDELVAILLGVAEWLEPATIEVDGVERAGGPPVTLADVRAMVSDVALRAVARHLAAWNRDIALAPKPRWSGCTSDSGRERERLPVMADVGGEVVEVESLLLDVEDPRLEAASDDHERAVQRRARDLEALLGLPAGTFED